ncbi:MAG: flagellar hook assembly protein FlgD [Wenzhouxiangellaceae bacterium]|nr:flagellar hook assembly protein FlgD [Wenzhouxiangellaceae bacterium]
MNEANAIQEFARQFRQPAQNNGVLGQDDFLRLMITQLRNQDPFQPMENGQFLGQMAQFSTVTGINQLNDSFAAASSALTSNQALQAASLVGREMLVPSESIHFDGTAPARGALAVPPGASGVSVSIFDASGELVRQFPATIDPALGRADFSWDGLGADGEPLPAGTYRIEAQAQLPSGSQSLVPLVWGRIDSVSLAGPGGRIDVNLLGLGSTSLSQALEIG